MSTKLNYFAEVIESTLQSWKAQCWNWDRAPVFGALVVIDTQNGPTYGIVHQVYTGSDDPSRGVFAYQKTVEELQREQPQVFIFLKTTFTALTVGYMRDAMIKYSYAPTAPSLHAFVREATPEEYDAFFAQPGYLHVLFGQAFQLGNVDELFLAIIRMCKQKGALDAERLASFVEVFSLLGNNDYRRLKVFLQRIECLD